MLLFLCLYPIKMLMLRVELHLNVFFLTIIIEAGTIVAAVEIILCSFLGFLLIDVRL